MPVVLITDKERFEWKHPETNTKLFYRRPTSAKQRELKAANTIQGRLDNDSYLEDLIEYAVIGWGIIDPEQGDGFVDENGEPLEFFEGATRGLPEPYKAAFVLSLWLIDPIQREMGN